MISHMSRDEKRTACHVTNLQCTDPVSEKSAFLFSPRAMWQIFNAQTLFLQNRPSFFHHVTCEKSSMHRPGFWKIQASYSIKNSRTVARSTIRNSTTPSHPTNHPRSGTQTNAACIETKEQDEQIKRPTKATCLCLRCGLPSDTELFWHTMFLPRTWIRPTLNSPTVGSTENKWCACETSSDGWKDTISLKEWTVPPSPHRPMMPTTNSSDTRPFEKCVPKINDMLPSTEQKYRNFTDPSHLKMRHAWRLRFIIGRRGRGNLKHFPFCLECKRHWPITQAYHFFFPAFAE